MFNKNAAQTEHYTLDGEQHHFLQQAHLRIIMIMCLFMIGFFCIAWRLTVLSLFGVQDIASTNTTKYKNQSAVYAPRANITDRNGQTIATTLVMPALHADPSQIQNHEALLKDLARILPIDIKETRKLIHKDTRFVWLYHALTPKQQKTIHDLGYPGLGFQDSYRRIYPQNNLFSHVLGYNDRDNIGISGLEKQYDARLSHNQDLQLTLDVRLQNILKTELQKSITHFEALGGAGIIMHIKTGEILAMTSLPDFDPHHPAKSSKDKRFNRNTVGVFEMGSTFKLFSIAAAIDAGAVRPGEYFDTRKPLKVGGHTIRDYHPEKKPVTLKEVFLHSSNIGTGLVAQKLGTDGLKSFYQKLGLFDRLDVDLPEKARPLLPPKWRESTTVTASYGHGMAVTPLHLVRAGAAIVNNGILPTPHFVLNEQNHTQDNAENTTDAPLISPRTSAIMRDYLYDVVHHEKGTGKKAAVDGYAVGGKTGTAEKVNNGTYARKALFSSFLGFFPMDDPQYVILVSVDEPKGQKDSFGYATAGWTAAPVASKVIAQSAPLLGLQPQNLGYESLTDYVTRSTITEHTEHDAQ